MDDDDDVQAEEWTLDDLLEGGCDEGAIPPLPVLKLLVEEQANIWLDEAVNPEEFLGWCLQHYNLSVDDWTWDRFALQHAKEHHRMCKFKEFFSHHRIETGGMFLLFSQVTRVMYMMSEFLLTYGRLYKHAGPGDPGRAQMTPSEAFLKEHKAVENGDTSLIIVPEQDDNAIIYDPEKNTTFQNLVLHLCKILELCSYRRADNKFFERIRTKAKMKTMAFKQAYTVEEFCNKQCNKDVDWYAFMLSTNPVSNQPNIVTYMQKRPISEAPELEENHHLRSFDGDEFGRYAGVYDSGSDCFFPYGEEQQWHIIAERVQEGRRKLFGDPKYQCNAPPNKDVCIVHLDAIFPYDIYQEVMDLKDVAAEGRVWRLAEPYECEASKNRLSIDSKDFEFMAREWDAECKDLETVPLHDASRIPECGRKWSVVEKKNLSAESFNSMIPCPTDTDAGETLKQSIQAGKRNFDAPPLDGLTEKHYVDLNNDNIAVPWEDPPKMPRFVLDKEFSKRCFPNGVTRDSFVSEKAEDGSVMYFKPHTGRTWKDCDTKDVDHIYLCQKFVEYDRFFLYALKGRTLFEVGEFDPHQMCLFMEGIGGCGKSTIMLIHLNFIPSHLRGVLSSNIQAQFGMSAVARKGKSRIVVCNEVASDLNLLQEEWQTTVSGEEGSYAVKYEQQPLVLFWKAQHYWIGNTKPTKFNNRQGQVSRRLAGILMPNPVMPRDGNIKYAMLRKLGHLLRKECLAYHDFYRFTSGTDPMSEPDKLPPAFRDFYHTSRRMTDPMVDFLSNKKFVQVEEGSIMLMKDFRELFTQFRLENDMGKPPRWSDDIYRTPFNERGIMVADKKQVQIGNVEYHNVTVIYNLKPVAEQYVGEDADMH